MSDRTIPSYSFDDLRMLMLEIKKENVLNVEQRDRVRLFIEAFRSTWNTDAGGNAPLATVGITTFDGTTNTMTMAANTYWLPGMTFYVNGSTSNDGLYTVKSVNLLDVITEESFTTEAALGTADLPTVAVGPATANVQSFDDATKTIVMDVVTAWPAGTKFDVSGANDPLNDKTYTVVDASTANVTVVEHMVTDAVILGLATAEPQTRNVSDTLRGTVFGLNSTGAPSTLTLASDPGWLPGHWFYVSGANTPANDGWYQVATNPGGGVITVTVGTILTDAVAGGDAGIFSDAIEFVENVLIPIFQNNRVTTKERDLIDYYYDRLLV